MATKLWERPISKNVDWGGDNSTDHLPVSGKIVQQFIKETLAKKFGYLYYDRDALKYYVFADEDDYTLYSQDSLSNAKLLLATFDAPPPATIAIVSKSADTATVLLNAPKSDITFNYYIVDKSNNPVAEPVSLRAVIARAGEQQTFTSLIQIDKENYTNENVGTSYSLKIDDFLKNEGSYTITITLTGVNTQASTVLTFFYTVVNLELSVSSFEYYKPFYTNVSQFEVPFTIKGAAGILKTMEILVDDEPLIQSELGYNAAISSGDNVGSNGSLTSTLLLYNKTFDGDIVKWPSTIENNALRNKVIFSAGKHTLQMRVYIPSDDPENPFYSKTQYLEFVVVDEDAVTNETFLLYVTDADAGTIFNSSEPIKLKGQQYDGISLNIAAIDSKNRENIPVRYTITGRNTGYTATVDKKIKNQSIDKFTRIFDTADIYDLNISVVSSEEFPVLVVNNINAVIEIKDFTIEGETIEESLPNDLRVKYTAINRSNSEVEKDVWKNSSSSDFARLHPYPATFNNVLWNEQSGWDGTALTLKNGATVELPIDMFNENSEIGMWGVLGFTFEIDFETFEVQDDDSIIMDFSDPATTNVSYLKITATSAELRSNRNVTLKTNFKDGVRNKIAFSFNPTTKVEGGVSTGEGNPNLVLIYVNGVLDRASKWGNGEANSDGITWGEHTTKSVIIGNPSGAAGVKIYSIRIYNKALVPEEAFMNYVVDQGSNIPTIIKKNHIYEDGAISLELVKNMIPTMVLSTDYTLLNNQTNKKNNTMYELQYYDPVDPSLNFFVRNGWISLQGTSSMQYPTKNLRPYLNKNTSDGKTFQYSVSASPQAMELTNLGIKVSNNFNTEFWPASEWRALPDVNEDSISSDVDNLGIIPYSVNKKEIIKDKFFANAYHEIGAGMSKSYIIDLATKYSQKEDITGNKVDIYYKNGTRTIIQNDKEKTIDRYDIITSTEDATIAEQIANIVNNGGSVYISAYRPLRRRGWEKGSAEYWKYIKELRYSGVALYTKKSNENEDGGVGYDFSKAKKLDKNTEYFGLGTYWRQYDESQHYSGWTDRWTLKADYAESSMTHNAGVARVWGNALRNFKTGGYAGITAAQSAVGDVIDIRTSCDGKPIVLFVKEPDKTNPYNMETGKVNYSSAKFAGLFNIMTDKSSTPLFGFEDIKNEENTLIWDASKVQCWEFLQNGSLIANGSSLAFDTKDEPIYNEKGDLISGQVTWENAKSDDNGLTIGNGRPIFTDFEPRWPEDGSAKHVNKVNGEDVPDIRWYQDDVFGTESNAFESFWNWVNFTKPAIKYEVNAGGDIWLDGYDLNPYVQFANLAEANAWKAEHPTEKIYWKWDNSGNIAYAAEGEEYGLKTSAEGIRTFTFNGSVESDNYYWHNDNINFEKVRKTINTAKIGDASVDSLNIGGEVYKVGIYGFDSLNHCRREDGTLNDDEAMEYLVYVYMRRQGTKYFYNDSYGNKRVEYKGMGEQVDPNEFMYSNDNMPFSQKTYMQFFEDTMEDHIDIAKVAAYYIYIMRFGAVDQVIKNSMMTTEDGEHWYFINYDNDTVLGVRNDAQLIFNWDFDRDTYDYTGNSYAYAGAKSVFWNNLSMSDKFMNIVKTIDGVLYSTGFLSAKTVLQYLDEKQMGIWCERLYNEQEQIKYLSTFKNNFETDKFLLFMQGTRQSHRNWWVNHRWELFDAKWETGSYSDKRIKFYEIITEASNDRPLEFMKITAAAKYYFTVQKNNSTITNGFVELKAGDSATFETRTNIAIGDPMVFIGPQKLKVLNFRPGKTYLSSTLSLNESYDIASEDGTLKTNWVDESGTMVTKLLIGDNVSNKECPLTKISGMNTITSLEEIDLRTCGMLTESPSVTQLPNLHRYRAENSAATIFEPMSGAILYEVSLPSQVATKNNEIVVTDETTGEPVQAKNEDGTLKFDEDGKPVYETTVVTNVRATQILRLNNVIFMRQPVSEYVSYQGDDDKLPYTETIDEETGEITLGGIYNNEDAFKYTSESKAIFNITPTIRLSNVIFNNVTGLDTKKFVMDWKKALIDANESPRTRRLELTNINWKDITVNELIEFVKGYDKDDNYSATFTIENFSGIVNVVSEDTDPETGKHLESIGIDEYNRIIDYFGEEVFTAGNPLVITTGENLFYQPTVDTITKEYTLTSDKLDNYISSQILTSQINDGAKIYEVIRGNTFKAKAVRFPNNGKTYKYVLSGWGWDNGSNKGYSLKSDIQTDPETGGYKCNEYGVKLYTDKFGNAVLTATDSGTFSNSNAVFAITTVEFNGDVPAETVNAYAKDYNVYVRTVNRIVPAANRVIVSIDDSEGSVADIYDEEEHEITFDLGASTNAPIKSIEVTHDNNVTADIEHYTLTNDNKLIIKFTSNIPRTNTTVNLTFRITFVTDQSNKYIEKPVTLNLKSIYADVIKVYEIIDNEEVDIKPENTAVKYEINTSGVHTFKVKLSSSTGKQYNIPITSYLLDYDTTFGATYDNFVIFSNNLTPTDVENEYTFTLTINNNNHITFARVDELTLSFFNKFDVNNESPITFTTNIISTVIYPDIVDLSVQDYNGNPNNYVYNSSTDHNENHIVDIYLLHNQGTKPLVAGNDYVELIPGQNYIDLKLIPRKRNVYDPVSDKEIFRTPTEEYELEITEFGTQSELGYVTFEYIDGNEHGLDTIRLYISAAENKEMLVTYTGKYHIVYDVDRNLYTDNSEDHIVDFTVNIHYTVASGNTYNKLLTGQWYLVDEDSNYYSIDINDLDEQNMSPTTIANSHDITFIGAGYVLAGANNINTPIFVYFRHDNVYRSYSTFFANNSNSLGSDVRYYYNGNRYPFNGYDSTNTWVNQERNAPNSGWQGSGFKRMWELYEDNDRVSLYIPSYQELMLIFGTKSGFYFPYDDIIAYLQRLNSTKYNSIITLNDTLITYIGDDTTYPALFNENKENPHSNLWFICSSTFNDVSNSICLTFMCTLDDEINDIAANSVVYMPMNVNTVSELGKCASMLPFIKVS